MQQSKTTKGERLPDLLVVLAITVVMAAILLPAVTDAPMSEVDAVEISGPEYGAMDGSAVVRNRDHRFDREKRSAADRDALAAELGTMAADAEATPDSMVETGMRGIRTTDISYTIP